MVPATALQVKRGCAFPSKQSYATVTPTAYALDELHDAELVRCEGFGAKRQWRVREDV